MKNHNSLKLRFSIVILLLAGLSMTMSCSKNNESMDSLVAYLPPGNVNTYISADSIGIMHDKIIQNNNAAFPVYLTRAFSKDVQVTAKIDTALVKEYNVSNGTNFPAVPEGVFVLANDGMATVKAGKTASDDSIIVKAVKNVFDLTEGNKTYLIPVVLTTAAEGVPVSETRKVMYKRIVVFPIISKIVPEGVSGNTVSVNFSKGGDVIKGTDKVYIRAFVNYTLPQNAAIPVETDESLIAAYNQSMGTSCVAFPQNTWKFIKDAATISAGSFVSADSIGIQLQNLVQFAPGVDYLLPIKIKDEGSDSPTPDPKNNIVYVRVMLTVTNIYEVQNPVGDAVPRTPKWSATASSSSYGEATNAIDNSYSTSWMGQKTSNGRLEIEVNLGAVYTLQSFQISPNYRYAVSYNYQKFKIETSTDNTNWTDQGTYTVNPKWGGTMNSPDIRYWAFFSPVTAQYIKVIYLDEPRTSNYFGGISEFNVFH